MAAERPGRGELAEAMSDHVLGDEHGHVLAAVVDRHRVPDEVREDHGRARPGLHDLALVPLVHALHADEKPLLDERSLLDRTRHALAPLALPMAAADDQPAGGVRATRAIAHGGLPPRRLGRHAGRRLALATTMRVVTRGHRDATHLGPLAHVARTSGLAQALVLVIEVRHLPDRGEALRWHAPHLARGETDGGEVALLGQELRRRAGGPDDLAALAGHELDVVDRGAERDPGERD